jgi:hypothetical protein
LKAHIKKFAISVSRYKNEKKKNTLKSDIYAKKNLLKCIATKKIILSRVFIYLFYKYKCSDCAS